MRLNYTVLVKSSLIIKVILLVLITIHMNLPIWATPVSSAQISATNSVFIEKPNMPHLPAISKVTFERNLGQHSIKEKFIAIGKSYQVGFDHDHFTIYYKSRENVIRQIRVDFLGNNHQSRIDLADPRKTISTYHNGKHPADWYKDIKSYSKVRYTDLYDGIDMVFYGTPDGRLEFDFIVQPDKDPSQIRLQVCDDQGKISLDSSGAIWLTNLIALDAPYIYQDSNEGKQTVAGNYFLDQDIIKIDVNSYDQSFPLIIDPIITYSTFSGGSDGSDVVEDITVDEMGAIYMLGKSNFSHQWYIAKLQPGALDFDFIYWYGSKDDFFTSTPRHIILDSDQNIIVDLTTTDPALPTKNALRSNFAISPYIVDIYVLKIDQSGEIIFATYFGGSKVDPQNNPLDLNGRDYTSGIVVDKDDNIFIAGETDGLRFPTTSGALVETNQGNWDLFLSKFSPSGSLLYSSLLGGFENDRINTGGDVKDGIAIDSEGRVYLMGKTSNPITNFPAVGQAFDDINPRDRFLLSIFDSKTNQFIYTSFLHDFEPKFIKIDDSDRVHLAGSGEWPDLVKPIAIEGNQFLMTMSPLNKQVHFSSFLPCDDCRIENYTVAGSGHTYFSALIRNDLATTTEGQIEFPLGKNDVYLGEVDVDQAELVFATIFGGSDSDNPGGGLVVSKDDKLYVAGNTRSSDFFTTPDALTPFQPGNGDVFLTIFNLGAAPTIVTILDANPDFIDKGFLGSIQITDIRQIIDPGTLMDILPEARRGVAADGTSDVVLLISSHEEIEEAVWEINEEEGKIETPWGSGTFNLDGEEYFIALYTPPVGFPIGKNVDVNNAVASISVAIDISYEIDQEDVTITTSFKLYRPPVVLVHGTFDNPENCWKTPISPSANSMSQAFAERGFKVFSVDYASTNGASDSNFPGTEPSSSFQANRKVVYENPGGIKEAIRFFREDLDVACTQADVVGHSMGGVLPRVLASQDERVANRYNDDYYSVSNFNQGHINRLITIASTHHGSDLSYFMNFFNDSWKNSDLPLLTRLGNTTIPYVLWLAGGLSQTGAIRDQIPSSVGLKRIGPTQIPSHAIVCTVDDINNFESNAGEPETFATYANILNAATAFFYFYHPGLQAFVANTLSEYRILPQSLKNANTQPSPFLSLSITDVEEFSKPSKMPILLDQIESSFTAFWQDWHLLLDGDDGNWILEEKPEVILQYETAEYQHFENDDSFLDHVADNSWNTISGTYQNPDVVEKGQSLNSIDFLRYLIFKNDLNDGVVRYESQMGGLSQQNITHFDNHIHSYAPRYPEIINRVINLLEGGLEGFAIQGFPAAGRRQPMAIPNPDIISAFDKYREDCEAACWSGMVPAHAFAFAEVARENDVVILGRPVNPDATPLILKGAATKGMNLKGKSSNWGPQKGYIPVNQRYSKLWELYKDNEMTRQAEIKKFSAKTKKQLKDAPNEAVKRLLTVSFEGCPQVLNVFYDSLVTDAKKSIFLAIKKDDNFEIYPWLSDGDPSCPLGEKMTVADLHNLDSLLVMATPDPELREEDGKPRFYTADYDLLAIGFHDANLAGWEEDPYVVETLTNFNPEKGFITEDQQELLLDLNTAVKETGYTGGDVSHHGPENQFYVLSKPEDGSPYVDYPITAFYLEDGQGKILAIPRGPAGFRDIYLKRFMAKKRREGYHLYENIHAPGWQWKHYHGYTFEKGWDDRDAPNLKASPEEIPFPETCDCQTRHVADAPKFERVDQYSSKGNAVLLAEPKIFPNPASSYLNMSINSNNNQTLLSSIMTIEGRLLKSEPIMLVQGLNQTEIDISGLSSGSYILLLSSPQKIISRKFQIHKN